MKIPQHPWVTRATAQSSSLWKSVFWCLEGNTLISVCAHLLCSCHGTPEGRAFSHPSFSHICMLVRSPMSCLLFRLNSFSVLSLSSCETCSSPLTTLMSLHWNLNISLLYWIPSWTEHSRCGFTKCWVWGKDYIPWHVGFTPNAAQDTNSLLSVKETILGHIQVGASWIPRSSSAKMLSSWMAPAYTGAWSRSSPGAGPGTSC